MRASPSRRPSARRPPIGGGTRVYAILGDPVEHSLSPAMQNAAFAASGLDAVYVALHVGASALAAAVAGLRACGVAGWNVTVPHKEAMTALVDELRPRARACGAVNTVVRTQHGLVGDNTDGAGFVAALRDAGRSPRAREILLIGAGGSARGIATALLSAGCRRLVIANRTPARAEALVALLDDARTAAADLDLLAVRDEIGRFDVIVNSTSVSLAEAKLPRIALRATKPDVLCCDLMYGKPSPFLRGAARTPRATMDGLGMLLHQGALAFTLWTGRRAPREVMRRALAGARAKIR